jgi:Protein of unknown function (DUF1499)
MRSLPPEPVPRLAILARWLVLGGWAFAGLSIFAVRIGGVPVLNGLAVLGVSILLAALGIVAAVGALISIWHSAAPGVGMLARSLFLALVLLFWPAYMAFTAIQLPVINDITTNGDDPPTFSRSRSALDARYGHVPATHDSRALALQQEAYSDLATIVVEQDAEAVMALARRSATNLGWLIVDAVNPAGRTSTGRIDAVSTSFLFKLPTDITIRIRPGAGDTLIDLRIVSRYGRHDFGRNADMIRQFAREIEALPAAR